MSEISSAPAMVVDAELPKTLRYPWGLRVFMAFWTVLFAAFATAGGREQTEGGKWAIWLGFGALALLCGAVLLQTLIGGLRLESDRVERFGVLGRRSLMRTDIAGFRLSSYTGWRVRPMTLAPADPRLGRIGVFWGFTNDPVFKRWIAGYPDLGVDGPHALPPPVVWAGSQESLKRFALGLNIATGVVCAWTAFFHVPYALSLAVTAVLPWIGIAAVRVTYGAMAFVRPRSQKGPVAIMVVSLPVAVLVIRALADSELFDWLQMFIPLGVGAVVAVGGFLLLFRWMRNGLWWWVGPAFFGASYALAVFVSADVLLDPSPGQAFQAEVMDKTLSGTRTTSYNLQLAPWGPRTTTSTVTVDPDMFHALHIGDQLCIALHPGAFGMRWYKVAPCAPQTTPTL